jgi:hypothetical protein
LVAFELRGEEQPFQSIHPTTGRSHPMAGRMSHPTTGRMSRRDYSRQMLRDCLHQVDYLQRFWRRRLSVLSLSSVSDERDVLWGLVWRSPILHRPVRMMVNPGTTAIR